LAEVVAGRVRRIPAPLADVALNTTFDVAINDAIAAGIVVAADATPPNGNVDVDGGGMTDAVGEEEEEEEAALLEESQPAPAVRAVALGALRRYPTTGDEPNKSAVVAAAVLLFPEFCDAVPNGKFDVDDEEVGGGGGELDIWWWLDVCFFLLPPGKIPHQQRSPPSLF
jgi:hypothetical protein